jgi:hypothetical protein
MRKTTQAMRKIILPARFSMLSASTLEAMKKPAHTKKRLQPKTPNFLSRLLWSLNILLPLRKLSIGEIIAHPELLI